MEDNIEQFVNMYSVKRDWLQKEREVFTNLEKLPRQVKMSLDTMEGLLHELSLSKNNGVIEKNQNIFKELPLNEWQAEMQKFSVNSTV